MTAFKNKKKKKVLIKTYVDEDLYLCMLAIAKAEGRSLSNLANLFLQLGVGHQTQEKNHRKKP